MNEQPKKRHLNWWKVGFFVALIAFEVARELAVIASNERMAGDNLRVFGTPEYASAQGQWFRSDGGSPIVPGTVAITCVKQMGVCIEAQTVFLGDGIKWATTDLTIFETAEFSASAITYTNDLPDCAIYRVHVDLAQERVTATRNKKARVTNEACAGMEERIAMELGDGIERNIRDTSWMDDRFLPLANTLRLFTN